MRKNELSLLLKAVVLACIVIVGFLCAFVVPAIGRWIAGMEPDFAHLYWPCLLGIWASAGAVFYACFLVWQISRDLDVDKVFSKINVKRLQRIAWLALGDTALYALGAVVLYAAMALHIGMVFMLLPFLLLGACAFTVAVVLSRLVGRGVPEPEKEMIAA